MTLAFAVDIAPLGVNHAYKPARWGKRHGFVLTDEGVAFKACVHGAAALAAQGAPLEGDVTVDVRFFWPSERGDVDSPLKLILDALQGAAYANDRQVKRVTAERATDRQRPRMEVSVTALAPAVDLAARVPAETRRDLKALARALNPKAGMRSSVRRFAP